MIRWIQISCGSDCTGPYDVRFTKGMTVGQFIYEILTNYKSEWGYIGIDSPGSIFGRPCIEYSHGELKEGSMPEEYMNKIIAKVKGSGGWSRSDFQLVLEEESYETKS